MKTTLIARFFVIILILLPFRVLAQGQTDVYTMEREMDLYDEHGFMKGKALSQRGSLNVSNSNGNLTYVYPVASYTKDGYPINVSLNYCGSVKFTAFEHYTPSSINNVGSISQITTNKPAWMLSVNNFALQVFAQNSEMMLNQSYTPSLSNNKLRLKHWVIDGYDFCNTMRPLLPSQKLQGYKEQTDFINILRADGSMLTLIKAAVVPGGFEESQYNETDRSYYSGRYAEKGVNTKGYAIVRFLDSTELSSPHQALIRTLQGEKNASKPYYKYAPNQFIPREVRYFPGDGLEYVFVEWKFPFGPSYRKSLVKSTESCSAPSLQIYKQYLPSVFYLQAIRSDFRIVMKFNYDHHKYPKYDEGYYENTTENLEANMLKGRASLVAIDNNPFIIAQGGWSSVTANGREVQFRLGKESAGVNAQIRSENFFYIGEAFRDKDILETRESTHQMITEIRDPMSRVISFDYQGHTRSLKKYSFITSCTFPPETPPVIEVPYYRLHKVKEPDFIVKIHYRKALVENGDSANTNVQQDAGSTVDGPIPWNVNDVVSDVTRYCLLPNSSTYSVLSKDEYTFPSNTTHGSNLRTFTAKACKQKINTSQYAFSTSVKTTTYSDIFTSGQSDPNMTISPRIVERTFSYEVVNWQATPWMEHYDFTNTDLVATSVTLSGAETSDVTDDEIETTYMTYKNFYKNGSSIDPYIVENCDNSTQTHFSQYSMAIRLPSTKRVLITKRTTNNTSYSYVKSAVSYQYDLAKTKDFSLNNNNVVAVSDRNGVNLSDWYYGYSVVREKERIHNPENVAWNTDESVWAFGTGINAAPILYTNVKEYMSRPDTKVHRDFIDHSATERGLLTEFVTKLFYGIVPSTSTQEDYYANNKPDAMIVPSYSESELPYYSGLLTRNMVYAGDCNYILSGTGYRYQKDVSYVPGTYFGLDRGTLLADTVFGKYGVSFLKQYLSIQ